MENQTKRLLLILILPLILLTVVVYLAVFRSRPDFLLHVNFYNLGQGHAALIQTYLGHKVLVDGGPTDAILQNLGQDLPFYDRTIDLLVLSNPKPDHVAGLVSVLKRFRVKKVLLADVKYNLPAYQEFLKLIEQNRIEKIYAQQGQRLWLDSSTVFDVLLPRAGELDDKQLNDAAIMGRLSFGKIKFLLVGSTNVGTLTALASQFDLQAQVLDLTDKKADLAGLQDFVAKISPQYVIQSPQNARFISDGTNLYKQ